MTMEPGENPSLRFHSVGSIGLPSPPSVTSAPVRGIAARLKLTLRPVSVFGSAIVKKSFGKGSRHAAGRSGHSRRSRERERSAQTAPRGRQAGVTRPGLPPGPENGSRGSFVPLIQLIGLLGLNSSRFLPVLLGGGPIPPGPRKRPL